MDNCFEPVEYVGGQRSPSGSGRECNTPISWSNPVDRLMLGPNLLKQMELIVK